jgi:glutathione peroxidase
VIALDLGVLLTLVKVMALSSSIYEFSTTSLEGDALALSSFKDKVMLIVNTASQCGFTSQYSGLQKLYDDYSAQGLVVLGFPCNQFGAQEPGNDQEIQSFCQTRYGVTFPLSQKIDVNGGNAHPLYQFLKDAKPGLMGLKDIKWNFTKFLVDGQGNVVKRYAPTDTPEAIAKDIAALLA